MNGVNLANKISIFRIMLIPFFIASIVYSRLELALILFITAIISDGVDGFIARVMNQKTKLGTILDPLADKLLLVSAYICLTIAKNIPSELRPPPYVPIIIISRDAIIVLGSIMVHMITGEVKAAPSMVGKLTTFFQMMTITSILVQFNRSSLIWNLTVILTVISGIDYIIKGTRLLGENHLITKRTP